MSVQLKVLLPSLALVACASALAGDTPQLTPANGSQVGLIFEAYLSPWQEGGEESDTPERTPAVFKSTTPSLTRAEREKAGHRGHGIVRFTKDLSRAMVDVKIEGTKVKDINMFHIHCGSPGVLGPVLVDFSNITDIQKNFGDDNVFSVVVDDKAITATTEHAHGLVGLATAGCVVPGHDAGSPAEVKASTVAGMAMLAAQGQIYFNIHTTGQTFYGDLRGQWWPATSP